MNGLRKRKKLKVFKLSTETVVYLTVTFIQGLLVKILLR